MNGLWMLQRKLRAKNKLILVRRKMFCKVDLLVLGKLHPAKVVCQVLGFRAFEAMQLTRLTTRKNGHVLLILEVNLLRLVSSLYLPSFSCNFQVNAIDSHGKVDARISKGKGGSNANFFKELVSNASLGVNMDWLVMISSFFSGRGRK